VLDMSCAGAEMLGLGMQRNSRRLRSDQASQQVGMGASEIRQAEPPFFATIK